jgi:hypothetical protein
MEKYNAQRAKRRIVLADPRMMISIDISSPNRENRFRF